LYEILINGRSGVAPLEIMPPLLCSGLDSKVTPGKFSPPLEFLTEITHKIIKLGLTKIHFS
jgi:hypothetical protein